MNDDTQQPRYPVVTRFLCALNVLLYLIQVGKGVDWLNPTPASLLAWGGSLGSALWHADPYQAVAARASGALMGL